MFMVPFQELSMIEYTFEDLKKLISLLGFSTNPMNDTTWNKCDDNTKRLFIYDLVSVSDVAFKERAEASERNSR